MILRYIKIVMKKLKQLKAMQALQYKLSHILEAFQKNFTCVSILRHTIKSDKV